MDEHGFTGGHTIIEAYMRERERRGREMFVPLAPPPGHAQADFGEATVVIGGVERQAHFFALDLPHSDACYVRAYPAATSEAWPPLGRSPRNRLPGSGRPCPRLGLFRAGAGVGAV